MTGLAGTVVDAAIGWLVQSILGSLFTEQMVAWTREIGLAEDVDKLKLEMKYVEMVLAAAEGRRIDNKPLAQSVDDLRELLYDSEDVMDELDYYRLQQQIEEGKGCSASTSTNPEGSYVPSSSSVAKLLRSATSQITDWISRGRKRKREEEGQAHCNMLPFEIKDSISKRINETVNLLHSNGNFVQRALQLETLPDYSIIHLPVHLQRCFSYCSLFPEDYRFNGEILVYAWISQSFVQCEDPTVRLEETGQKYLDRLVDLGFFHKVGSHYVMHDLMHELAGTVSSNECATVHGLKPVAIRPSVRHLSIITTAFDKDECGSFPNEKFDKILQKVGPLQKLRTLMLFGRSSINLLESLHTLCKKAKCLRFLRICVTAADISSIHSLLNPCHLRYLEYVCVVTKNLSSYGDYNNIAFPQALTRFYHLQVLNVGISGNLAVPTDMHNLVNLRHLISHEKVHHAIACVGNMTSLQELRFKVQNVGSFEISQLQSMDELVQLKISQLENVKTKEEARGAWLLDKEYLKTLSLSWEDNSTSLQPETANDVLEGLQPHQDLKSLEITGYGGATSPTWLSSTLSVTSLQILHLENCREWKILQSIEIPSLRS